MTNTLKATINGQPLGVLRDEAGYWAFEYDPAWLNSPDGFAIAPCFPLMPGQFADNSTTRHVAWFFDNLLPEEAAREVLAQDARVTVDDAWGLLAYFGAESAGAITLLPEAQSLPEGGLVDLPDAELQRRIEQMPTRSLSADAPKRMSLAGAQHKLAVSVVDGVLYEPVGNACSTHILKPDSKNPAYPHAAINEHFCMCLAKALKLDVPATAVRYVPWPVYLVERFDRVKNGELLQRSHVLDALQLLSLDRRLKYKRASAATLKSCIEACGAVLKTRQSVFAWVVFNVLIGNSDAHMKNISFIVDASGIRLAPFYDLLSTVVYATPQYDRMGPHWPNVDLSMPIGRALQYTEITRNDLLEVAEALGLGTKAAERILDYLVRQVGPTATALLASDFANVQPGERRLLDLICRLPIQEMATRLLPSSGVGSG